MIRITIPGTGTLALEHLVLDFNGTLACDGRLLEGVADVLKGLAEKLRIHVLTADTFGRAAEELKDSPCRITILPADAQDEGKRDYIRKLGAEKVVCVGNGRNDRLMLREAALGIAVVLKEGAALDAILAADVVCTDIVSALKLLLEPIRLVATLRI